MLPEVDGRNRALSAGKVVAAVICLATSAGAAPRTASAACRGELCHDGFFLRVGAGLSAHAWRVREDRIVSDGDAAEPPGDGARAERDHVVAPTLDLGVGGGGVGFAIGASIQAVEHSWGRSPITGCTVFGPFVVGYPWPTHGYYLEGRFGVVGCLAWDAAYEDLDYSGGMLGLGLGHEHWVGRRLSVGGGADVSVARLGGDVETDSRLERSAGVIGITLKVVVTVN
jgi:hypothetical protein